MDPAYRPSREPATAVNTPRPMSAPAVQERPSTRTPRAPVTAGAIDPPRERLGAVRDRGEGHEQRPEHQALDHRLRAVAQELWQEGGEEEGRLGIEQGDDDTIAEDTRQGCCSANDERVFGLRGVQGVDAKIDKIERPTYFTTVKATAETANSAPSPRDAANTLPRLPTATPATDASPTRRPWVVLRVTM